MECRFDWFNNITGNLVSHAKFKTVSTAFCSRWCSRICPNNNILSIHRSGNISFFRNIFQFNHSSDTSVSCHIQGRWWLDVGYVRKLFNQKLILYVFWSLDIWKTSIFFDKSKYRTALVLWLHVKIHTACIYRKHVRRRHLVKSFRFERLIWTSQRISAKRMVQISSLIPTRS